MMKSLWNSKFADRFHEPIDDQGYRNAVGNPLDLRIIQQKLESCEYHKADECLSDLHAMFSGCREYFKPGSPIYLAAHGLEALLLRKLKTLPQVDEVKQPPPLAWKRRYHMEQEFQLFLH